MSSFVGSGLMSGPLPPATRKGAYSEVLHLFRMYTHTPTRRRVRQLRSGQRDEDEDEGNESEMMMKMR